MLHTQLAARLLPEAPTPHSTPARPLAPTHPPHPKPLRATPHPTPSTHLPACRECLTGKRAQEKQNSEEWFAVGTACAASQAPSRVQGLDLRSSPLLAPSMLCSTWTPPYVPLSGAASQFCCGVKLTSTSQTKLCTHAEVPSRAAASDGCPPGRAAQARPHRGAGKLPELAEARCRLGTGMRAQQGLQLPRLRRLAPPTCLLCSRWEQMLPHTPAGDPACRQNSSWIRARGQTTSHGKSRKSRHIQPRA